MAQAKSAMEGKTKIRNMNCPVCDKEADARIILNPESGKKVELISEYEQLCTRQGSSFVIGYLHDEKNVDNEFGGG